MPRDRDHLKLIDGAIKIGGPFVVVPCYEHPECRGALTCQRPRRLVWLRRRIGLWLMLLGAFGLGYYAARLTEHAPRVDLERTP
jgi:hypothetical protein